MVRLVLPVSALLLSYALLVLGHGLFGTLLAVRMIHEGFASEIIGLVLSAYYLGFVGGTLLCGPVIERVGHIRVFSAFAAIAASVALVHALSTTPLVWALLRLVTGFCHVGLLMVTESWLNAKTTNEIRGGVLSFYMIVNYLGIGTGQFLLHLADPGEFQLFSVVAILFALSLVPIALTRSETPTQLPMPDSALKTPIRFNFRQLYRVSPLGVGSCFVVGLLNSAFFAMGPVFAADIGLPVTGIANFMGFAIFSALLLQWPIGRLSDRYDRRRVILVVALFTAAVSFAIVAMQGRTLGWLLPLVYAYSSVAFALYGLSVAHANDLVAQEHRIAASAGLLLAFGLGAIAGPTLSSMLIAHVGPSGLFLFSAIVAVFLALFALYRMLAGVPVPAADKADFVAVPATTPVLTELDPRTEPVQGTLTLAEQPSGEPDPFSPSLDGQASNAAGLPESAFLVTRASASQIRR